ncbi:MAG: helix-turn-helix transcriptional regulator [Elusimicrobiota bacterium]|nr:helix-turn-helix transcriptional regulator [Elusimicrobiota bacterium]
MPDAPTWFLREWRLQRGWTQERLAEALGVHKGDVSKLERGQQRWNATHLQLISTALDLEPWWLVQVDPTDPANNLEALEALRHVPAHKMSDAVAVLRALGERREREYQEEPPTAPPPRPRRRRS